VRIFFAIAGVHRYRIPTLRSRAFLDRVARWQSRFRAYGSNLRSGERMHILFLSHYFPSEVNAPALRTYENASVGRAQGTRSRSWPATRAIRYLGVLEGMAGKWEKLQRKLAGRSSWLFRGYPV